MRNFKNSLIELPLNDFCLFYTDQFHYREIKLKMSQNQGNNNSNADVLQHSSDIRNQPGGSNQGKFN